MSGLLKIKTIDFANLVIAKGVNFFLTALLFSQIAIGMNQQIFADFGYWWSIAIMVGGIMLGGVSSALIRVVILQGTLRRFASYLHYIFLVFSIALFGITLIHTDSDDFAVFFGVLILFGIAVQLQTVVLGLIRVLAASRANFLASITTATIIFLIVHIILGDRRELILVFGTLSTAYLCGAVVALLFAYRYLENLFKPVKFVNSGVSFFSNAAAFTSVNIFSYGILNIDFTLFRLLGSPQDFAIMATGKVFFERFALPALLVFSGAASLHVLRSPHDKAKSESNLQIKISYLLVAMFVITVVGLGFAYKIFASKIRGDANTIGLMHSIFVSGGYLLFAVNAVLMDLLVIRRSLRVVLFHIVMFIIFAVVLQGLMIIFFGIPGWALGWPLFNIMILLVLFKTAGVIIA